MKIGNFENRSVLENKREGPKSNESIVNPERGGIITSLKLDGKEILYMDYYSYLDLFVLYVV